MALIWLMDFPQAINNLLDGIATDLSDFKREFK